LIIIVALMAFFHTRVSGRNEEVQSAFDLHATLRSSTGSRHLSASCSNSSTAGSSPRRSYSCSVSRLCSVTVSSSRLFWLQVPPAHGRRNRYGSGRRSLGSGERVRHCTFRCSSPPCHRTA
jgi:hypothetical protein